VASQVYAIGVAANRQRDNCSGGEIGRRTGLKILGRVTLSCRFNSGPEHHLSFCSFRMDLGSPHLTVGHRAQRISLRKAFLLVRSKSENGCRLICTVLRGLLQLTSSLSTSKKRQKGIAIRIVSLGLSDKFFELFLCQGFLTIGCGLKEFIEGTLGVCGCRSPRAEALFLFCLA
jgi:hypothetical protein